jgi:hypothetical protein
MSLLHSFRARTAVVGFTALLALSGQALPAAAAGDQTSTFKFHLAADNDVTNFVPCPPRTPTTVMMCGYGANIAIDRASNDGDDVGLSGTRIKMSFVSTLDYPAPLGDCKVALKNYSAVTLKTTRGDIFLSTHDGAYCVSTATDVEPFTIVGGTGDYRGATGSGTIIAYPTKPQTATQGFARETFDGTISVVGSRGR